MKLIYFEVSYQKRMSISRAHQVPSGSRLWPSSNHVGAFIRPVRHQKRTQVVPRCPATKMRYYMCRNYVDIRHMHQATLLHQVLNFLVVFWVNNTRYDFGECTIETAVLENIGVALGIFDVSFLDSEIGGGVKFYPGVVQ